MELNQGIRDNMINEIKELNDDINKINKEIKSLQAKRDRRKNKIKALVLILSNQLELDLD
jgi:peptidoglycan hydrolase CwlO-like protein